MSNSKLSNLLTDNQTLIDQARAYLAENSIDHTLSEWITISEYAQRYNLESQLIEGLITGEPYLLTRYSTSESLK
ncbi:hypothetical protein [Spirosoma pollinicola]|uniref:Uncharacterized protein n=1 Tax=Spirosoma pollinicola TaxID=2057025 RepID=A0A2K8Z662_9BACT|nr:hypothetical protein [Spirosoma pollinicola]AUD05363.1 hypothetical protein CWM47_28020 [Spirosoma pollinicola]